MKVGILGFPKVGKTTVFNALTGSDIPTEKFSARSAKVNLGVAKVRDDRLTVLTKMYSPKKITPATVDYVDVPGFEPGGKDLAAYLAEFRGLDAVLHVVRAFEDDDLPHVFDGIDPARDMQAMEEEILLTDLTLVESRLQRIDSDLKKRKDPELAAEQAALLLFKEVLEAEQPLRSREWEENQLDRAKGLALLTLKPLLHLVNFGEDAAGDEAALEKLGVERFRGTRATDVGHLFGKIEAEISQLSAEDASAFLADLGLSEPTADRVAGMSYALLDLISFLTAGEKEVRAWPIRRGTVARRAAARIHSDIERGFIRAEVAALDDLVAAGSWAAAREKGTLRLEGKEYVVKDGDVVEFRFNV